MRETWLAASGMLDAMNASAPLKYTRPLIALHWLTALLVVACLILVWSADGLQDKLLRRELIGLHRSLGLTILLLTLLRLGLRGLTRQPSLIEISPLQALLARLAHAGLYVLLLVIPAVGWMLTSAAGRTVSWFGLIDLPALVAANRPFAGQMHELHELLATGLLLLVLIHAGAALWHHYRHKDATLRRMSPFSREG